MHKPLDSMNSNVLLARVSLRDNLLCVCDLKGVIVFASDDLLWALGLQGPTTRHIGASLFDLLADEDVEEYKNSLRRKSGSLLRCKQNGCFVWLDIQCVSHVPPQLKRALSRVQKARAAGFPSLVCLNNNSISENVNNIADINGAVAPHTMNNSPLNHQSKALASASCAWAAGNVVGLEENVLTKDRTLDSFLTPAGQEEESARRPADKAVGGEDAATEASDPEEEGIYATRAEPQASVGAMDPCLPSFGCLALEDGANQGQRATRSLCTTACTTSSSVSSSEQLGDGLALWTDEEQLRQQQEEAAMVREYSFREIFEYLSAGAKSMSRATSFSLSGSRASSTLNMGPSTAAASPSSPAAVLAQPCRDSRPFSERVAAKCRAAPEESFFSSHGLASGSSSWRLQNKYKVSGYVGKAAATLGLGTVKSAAVGASALRHVPPMLDESGWDWYVDV